MIKLGAIRRPKDKRDILLGSATAPIAIPDSYIPNIEKLHTFFQGNRPTCGANGITYLVALINYLQNGEVWTGSPRFTWEEVKKIDGYPLTAGTDLTSLFKMAKSVGICDYSRYPEEGIEDYSLTEYSIFTPTADDYTNTKKISGYGYGIVDVNRIKQDIYQYKGLAILAYVNNSWFSSIIPNFLKANLGHFFVGIGYDSSYLYIIDSATLDSTKRLKKISWDNLKWIRETGTICELTMEQKILINNTRNSLLYIVQNYTSKMSITLLNYIIESYRKYIASLGGIGK